MSNGDTARKFWVKAAAPDTLANGPQGLSHYAEKAHERAEKSWIGKQVDINHKSVKAPSESKKVGEIVDSEFVSGEGLFHKIEISSSTVLDLLEGDKHAGFSIGTRGLDSDGATIERYEPDHLSVILDPKKPMCDKETCDILSSEGHESMLFSQAQSASLPLPNDLERRVLRQMIEGKRFSVEDINDVVATVVGELQKNFELDQEGPGENRRRTPESISQFEDFEDCVLQFKDGGRSKDAAIQACERIFDSAKHGDCPQGKTWDPDAGECVEMSNGSQENNVNENVSMNESTGDLSMTECDCNDNISPEEFDALSSKVDELQDSLEEKEMKLSAKDETIEELKEENEVLTSKVETYESEKREELISSLPESDVDYEEKNLEELQSLQEFYSSAKKQTAGGQPAGTEDESNTSAEEDNSNTDVVSALNQLRGDN